MKIAVTGSSGFIGSHLLPEIRKMPRVELIEIRDLFGYIPKADIYIHLAAKPMIPYSVENPYQSYQVNVIGTLNILEACRHNKAKIIFASSSQASPEALSPYALEKHHCEELIELYGKLYHVHFRILRLYNVFGPGEHGVIGAYLAAAAEGKPLEIWGGFQKRDFVHVDTVVEHLIAGIDEEGLAEIGSGKTWSIQQIADMISDDQVLLPLKVAQPMETRCPTPVETVDVEEYINAAKN